MEMTGRVERGKTHVPARGVSLRYNATAMVTVLQSRVCRLFFCESVEASLLAGGAGRIVAVALEQMCASGDTDAAAVRRGSEERYGGAGNELRHDREQRQSCCFVEAGVGRRNVKCAVPTAALGSVSRFG
jgi:hypothetical protein